MSKSVLTFSMWAGELPVNFDGEQVSLKVREIQGNIAADLGSKEDRISDLQNQIKEWQDANREGEVNKATLTKSVAELEKAVRATFEEMILILVPDAEQYTGFLSTQNLAALFGEASRVAFNSSKKKQEALLSGRKRRSSPSKKRATAKKKSAAGTRTKRTAAKSSSKKQKSKGR